MKAQVTDEQVKSWMDARAKMLCEKDARIADLSDNPSFKLGILQSTLRSLLNNPHIRKELVEEISATPTT